LAQAGESLRVKKSILKFKDIAYPIFTLKRKPYRVIYENTKILCKTKADDVLQTVDDKSLSGDYFYRLLQLEHRITFDYTCKNLQDILFTGSKWGIDAKAVIHDFSNQIAVPVEKREVIKVNSNLVWLKNISYPFELYTAQDIDLKDKIYGTIIFVNGEWYLKEFSYENHLVRPYVFV
jgi:hypothetical protein